MIIINGTKMYQQPSYCGDCPFLFNYLRNAPSFLTTATGNETFHCRMFDEMHKSGTKIPARCKKLFKKAFKNPDGSELVIVGQAKQ